MPFYSFFAHSSRSSVPTLTFAAFADHGSAFKHAEAMLAKDAHYLGVEVTCGQEELGKVHQTHPNPGLVGHGGAAGDQVIQVL